MSDEYANQPPISDWKFIDQLKSPLHTKIELKRIKQKKSEASLKDGVQLDFKFDGKGLLDTVQADFSEFLKAANIRTDGKYKISTSFAETSCFEEYIINVKENTCTVSAKDTEGIRRGLIHLEDMIIGSGGPFIALGKVQRKPFIKNRVTRCFFGPINRPPLNRDELTDDVNYYPDEYLNRLAHEGVNGLWLSIKFIDLVPSRFFPAHGKDSKPRLAKLNQTVSQCARYGIKIYLYCNEPWAFGDTYYTQPWANLENNPQFAGHKIPGHCTLFCTSSKDALKYLEESTNFIFTQVPNLGGMICITHGEHPTNCYSYTGFFKDNNCPRCSKRKPWEVYHDQLEAMVKGVKKANKDAAFISWLYAPVIQGDETSSKEEKMEVFRQIAAHTPKDVIMQMNFESNGIVKQLGRDFYAYDYWLAWPGPSEIFKDCASNAVKAGAGASAKIQVGCSHENATIPFMPVPGSLYRKYSAMKELGVNSAMQCWYFGNYPGLMNKAAGELSFLPFAENENDFLDSLAKMQWADNYKKVSSAWKYFFKGYSNFPVVLSFTWFGPLHCSIVWPMHLMPVDQPIAPSWTFGFPDSGDRIGECIGIKHSLDDVLLLLKRMDENWQKGVSLLASIEKDYASNNERLMDIILSKAIGLQIRSARNIFNFYDMREKLPFMQKGEQLEALAGMEEIVKEEITNSLTMKTLCEKDPRLGFHSEAEGYKFFPSKLEWRAGLLKELLKKDFPKVSEEIKKGKALFPEYTGVAPKGKTYSCAVTENNAEWALFDNNINAWKSWTDGKKLYFEMKWVPTGDEAEMLKLDIEPRRLWPCLRFQMDLNGKKAAHSPSYGFEINWKATMKKDGNCNIVRYEIPYKSIPWFDGSKNLRINVSTADSHDAYINGWIKRNLLPARLIFGYHNSADMGWLFMDNK